MVTGYWNMFKQNIGIMIAVAQLAATQQRFADVQNEFRRFGMDIVAASVRRAQEQGYGADLDPDHTARGHRAAVRELHHGLPAADVAASGCRSPTRTPSPPCRRSGRRRCTATEGIEGNHRGFRSARTPSGPAGRDGRVHRGGDQAAGSARHMQYFDHRREFARTDWENGGIPRREWEDLLDEMRRRADKAGWLRYGLPSQFGGRDGTNLDMAVIREHLAHKGLGLHNDLQDESSIVGNFPQVIMMDRFGTDAQKKEWCEALLTGERSMAFGLTEPDHGSDATWLETRAVRDGDELGHQRRQALEHRRAPRHPRPGVRPHVGRAGSGPRHHRVPGADATPPGSPCRTTGGRSTCPPTTARWSSTTSGCPPTRCSARWTTASRSARRSCTRTGSGRPPAASAPRSTASTGPSATPNERMVFGKPLSVNQAVQWPLVELQTEAQMVRLLVLLRGRHLDRNHHMEVSDKVSMANYRANRLVCEAADRAMQVHGGVGYSRHEPFEHIYRHHRRYRITEGAEEIQIRRVAQRIFGFGRK